VSAKISTSAAISLPNSLQFHMVFADPRCRYSAAFTAFSLIFTDARVEKILTRVERSISLRLDQSLQRFKAAARLQFWRGILVEKN